tara:strand:- start:534 stop:638 length:105 start_codon:yes stop_codon:yes gene_type:complete
METINQYRHIVSKEITKEFENALIETIKNNKPKK